MRSDLVLSYMKSDVGLVYSCLIIEMRLCLKCVVCEEMCGGPMKET